MKSVVQKIMFATLLGATVLSAALAGAEVTPEAAPDVTPAVTPGEARALKEMTGFNPGDQLVLKYSYKEVEPQAFFNSAFLSELEQYGQKERDLLVAEKQALQDTVNRLEIARRAGGLNPLLAKRRLLGEARYRKALWDMKRINTDIEKAERLTRIGRLGGAVSEADEKFVRGYDFVATHPLSTTDDIVKAGAHFTALSEKPFKPKVVKVQQLKAKAILTAKEVLKRSRMKKLAGSSVVAMLAGYGYLAFESNNVDLTEAKLSEAVAKECGDMTEAQLADCEVVPVEVINNPPVKK